MPLNRISSKVAVQRRVVSQMRVRGKSFRRPPTSEERFLTKWGGVSLAEKSRRTEIVESILPHVYLANKGEGTTFVCPLTSSAAGGYFLQGLFRVVAPKARVLFVPTPKFNLEDGGRSIRLKPEAQKVLDKSHHIVIFDDYSAGTTGLRVLHGLHRTNFSGTITFENDLARRAYDGVATHMTGEINLPRLDRHRAMATESRGQIDSLWQKINEMVTNSMASSRVLGNARNDASFRTRFASAGWVKNNYGRFAMDEANALRYQARHGELIRGAPGEVRTLSNPQLISREDYKKQKQELQPQYTKTMKAIKLMRKFAQDLGTFYGYEYLQSIGSTWWESKKHLNSITFQYPHSINPPSKY